MTRAGRQLVIDDLAMRVFAVDEHIAKLTEEKKRLQLRIMTLEAERDSLPPAIVPQATVSVNG